MQNYTREGGVPHDIFVELKSTYARKYPYDFSMQRTLVQSQTESYLYMKKYLRAPGVPQKTFNKIKQKYTKKYPYDFSMQKTLIQDQVESYLDLQQ